MYKLEEAATSRQVSITFVTEVHIKVPVHQATAVFSQRGPAQHSQMIPQKVCGMRLCKSGACWVTS